jgi:carboxylesterase
LIARLRGGNGRGPGRALPALDASRVPAADARSAPPEALGFRETGRRIGCVLVHGLTSSPQSMRPLARALVERGIDVEGVLLPGHGTRPEDLRGVAWPDWYAAVAAGVAALRSRCDRVFVLGQSVGGTLALRAAAREPVDGVITLAALAYLRDWRLHFLSFLIPVMRWRRRAASDIARPGAVDAGAYDRMPLTTVQQLVDLLRQVRLDLPKVRVPALILHSKVDHVVAPDNARYIYAHLGSETKELVRLNHSYHVISLDNDLDLVVDRCVRFMRKIGYAEHPIIL